MPGRNKQPLSVIEGKGRKHLTKAEKEERRKHEIKAPIDNIKPPSYLSKKQKEEFEKISTELLKIGIFSNLDVDSLARYIDSKTQYLQLLKALKKINPTEEIINERGKKIAVANDDYPKLMRTKNTLFNECRSAASDLGLSITSRLKLVIPTKDEDKPKSESERRFGGRL